MEECGSKIRVVIADDEPITRMDLKELLESADYEIAGEASDGFDAVELCKNLRPDLVLMDIKMPFLDGISASKMILEEGLTGTIILLTAYSEREFIEQAKSIGVSGYLVKPIDEKSLIPSIELSVARSQEMQLLRKNIQKVSERLENRKIIEKAKGIVMEQQHMTEQESYDYIRNLSLLKNLSMKRISEIILLKSGVAIDT